MVDMSNTGSSEEEVDIYLEPALEVLAAGASTTFPHFLDVDGKEVCSVCPCVYGHGMAACFYALRSSFVHDLLLFAFSRTML